MALVSNGRGCRRGAGSERSLPMLTLVSRVAVGCRLRRGDRPREAAGENNDACAAGRQVGTGGQTPALANTSVPDETVVPPA